MEKISLITPTGGRPGPLKLCEKFVHRFTLPANTCIEWIIVTDSADKNEWLPEEKSIPNVITKIVRGPDIWREGFNTQRGNMNAGVEAVTGDYIFVIEDDDYYHPEYLADMMHLLKRWDIVGEGQSIYYNLKERSWKCQNNLRHASLCQTGLIKTHLGLLSMAVNSGELYFDLKFHALVEEHSIPRVITNYMGRCVGMKGLPGKGGIGVGHRARDFTPDPNFTKLKELVGEDYPLYLGLMGITKPKKAV